MKEQTKPQANPQAKKSEPVEEGKEIQMNPVSPEILEEITRLKQENASLKIQLKEQPQSLEDKIKYFQEKQANISKLAKLDAFAESLVKVGEDAQEESETDEFFSERFSVRISKKPNKYDRDWSDLLTIQNPVLVVEVLGYALERINTKRNQLKALIEA